MGIEFTLRSYQEKTRHIANTDLNKGLHPLIVMDTGTGKTKTDTAIIQDRISLGKRVFVICPGVEVFDQWLNDLAFLNPGYINDDGLRGQNRSVYVCMMLSLNNIKHMIPESLYPDELHTDEAHRSECETNSDIYDFFHKAQRLGMTATPIRTDGKPLCNHYTHIISEINIKEAFKFGYLTKFFYIGAEERLNLIPGDDEDIEDKKQAELLGTPQIIGKAVEVYEQYGDSKPWIIPCCTHQHAKDVREEFEKAGWIAEHLHGKLSKHIRASIVNKARTMKLNVITTVGVGVEGMDIPALHGIIWLRLTGSLTIWKQFNGRILRLFDGKEWAFIADLAGNAVLHGLPDKVYKWDINKGIDKEATEEDQTAFQKCPDCGTFNHIDNTECHFCGCDLSDEAKKEGTCRRCRSWKKGECIHQDTLFKPCPIWLLFEGCPSFQKRGRSLPAVIDGELVAIDSEMNRYELKKRTEKTKEEIKNRIEQEEKKKMECEEVTAFEKRKIISKGLFANNVRRSLFADAIGGM